MRSQPLRAALASACGTVLFLATAFSFATAATITRGPYLQIGRPDGVTLRWRTDTATDSRVRWGTSPTALTHNQDDSNSTTEHEVTLSGLTSASLYYYAVGTTSASLEGGTSDYHFWTSPPAGSSHPLRVWVIGDSGQPGSAQQRVRDAYLAYPGSSKTDVWLMLGDNAYTTGTDSEYQSAVFNAYPTILRNTVLWPTRGNHDTVISGGNNDYYDIFSMPAAAQARGLASGTEAYYSFDYANVHFVCLDSQGSSRSPTGAMLTWLRLDLAATTQHWVIAFWHHPPYSKGSHDSDTETELIEMRQNALPILEEGGVDLVLCGHSHAYERSMLIDGHYGTSGTLRSSMIKDTGDGDPNGNGAYRKSTASLAPHEGAVYAVSGSSSETAGGALNHPVMVTSLNVLGSMVLDVNGQTLDAAFLDDAGRVRDHFRIAKGATGSPVGQTLAPPPRLTLTSPMPNPTRGRADIAFSIPSPAHVRLAVFDVVGRRVASLLDESLEKGDHNVSWDGRSANGAPLSAGTYFVRLEASGQTRVKRIVRL